jgi:hypothetical protein
MVEQVEPLVVPVEQVEHQDLVVKQMREDLLDLQVFQQDLFIIWITAQRPEQNYPHYLLCQTLHLLRSLFRSLSGYPNNE